MDSAVYGCTDGSEVRHATGGAEVACTLRVQSRLYAAFFFKNTALQGREILH